MMQHILRVFTLAVVLALGTGTMLSQSNKWRDIHTVKKNETLYSISRDYDIAVEELMKANPETMQPGYSLKKGSTIYIPFTTQTAGNQKSVVDAAVKTVAAAVSNVQGRAVHLGVMLPLHDENGDGKRMVEYYRGVLMACDSLKANGISTDIRAWNLAEDGNVDQVLSDAHAADRDIIIGPLYTKQVKALGDFALSHDIRLLIPFSINSQELYNNYNIFQVFQNGNTLNDAFTYRYLQRFKGYHTVIIDCNDSTSTKGGFTSTLRRKLEQDGIIYSISNLRSSDGMFRKCFSTTQRNVVVLNTSRQNELNVAVAKLNALVMNTPEIKVTLFGYPEWLMYTRQQLDNFYKYDTYVPSTYYMDPLSPRGDSFRQKYRAHFHQNMQNYHQRFALTGFDQAYFFIKGLHMYGKHFTGAAGTVGYTPIQTPLRFERVGNGGLQNRAMLFVHYTTDNRIETLNF